MVAQARRNLVFVVRRPFRPPGLALEPVGGDDAKGVGRCRAFGGLLDGFYPGEVVTLLHATARLLGLATGPGEPLHVRVLAERRRLRLAAMPVAELPSLDA